MLKITIKYFAFMKDVTGVSEEEFYTDCSDIECLIDSLEKKYGKKFSEYVKNGVNGIKVSILINGETNIRNISDGDEIAFLPPPAGGDIIRGKLDFLEEVKKFRETAPSEAGSLVVYLGFVKGIVDSHKVYELDYEAYDTYTKRRIDEIEKYIRDKYKDVVNIKIIHAIDNMKPGDNVILIMCIGKGRRDAINAIGEAIELVKHTTGIWKLEIRDDGEYWVVAGNTRVKKDDKASSP